ncbi:MAG: hypothetical protein GC178_15795 [Flavobacteriales bacterium]|nr:hypothetical protein [Flavobacteriales bacterium]
MIDQENSGSECFVERLMTTLTKKEALAIRNHLLQQKTKEAELSMELFDAMRSSRTNDVGRLQSRLLSEQLKKHLSYYKGRLRENILLVLGEKQRDEELRKAELVLEEMRKSWALHAKGFNKEAVLRIEKSVDRLGLSGHPYLELMLLEHNHRVLRAIGAAECFCQLDRNHAQKKAVLEILRNMERYNALEEQVFDLYARFRQTRNSELLDRIDSMFNDPLLEDEKKARSFQARVSFNTAHMLQSRLKGDQYALVGYQERIVEIWESDPEQMARRPYAYQRALINLLNGYYSEKQRSSFMKTYAKARAVKLHGRRDRSARVISLLSVKLAYLLNQRLLEDASTMVDEIERAIAIHGKFAPMSTLMNLRFNTGVLYFLSDDFVRAKSWFEQLWFEKTDMRRDIQGSANILQVLCEFDRDNDFYVHSLSERGKRFYRMNKEVSGLDRLVFSLVHKLISRPPDAEKKILQQTLSDLQALNVQQPGILGADEVEYWIRSRLEALPIKNVFLSLAK